MVVIPCIIRLVATVHIHSIYTLVTTYSTEMDGTFSCNAPPSPTEHYIRGLRKVTLRLPAHISRKYVGTREQQSMRASL